MKDHIHYFCSLDFCPPQPCRDCRLRRGDDRDGDDGGSTPIPSGTLLFTATSNPSAGNDAVWRIAIDSAYMYVVGVDSSPGNYQGRIEKRNLSDGALSAAFGTSGVVTSNPSTGTDYTTGIAIDSTYMYVVGWDSSPGNNSQWRIEKRNLSDGALVTAFGTGGVVVSNPSASIDAALGIAVDSTYMYVVGWDSSPGTGQWRVEKRNLSDGALAAAFGTGGAVVSNPSASDDYAYSIAIDSTYMYVVGYDSSPGNGQGRIGEAESVRWGIGSSLWRKWSCYKQSKRKY